MAFFYLIPPKKTLVGGFNPFENISQIGNLPQIGVKIKDVWNHHLDFDMFFRGDESFVGFPKIA